MAEEVDSSFEKVHPGLREKGNQIVQCVEASFGMLYQALFRAVHLIHTLGMAETVVIASTPEFASKTHSTQLSSNSAQSNLHP